MASSRVDHRRRLDPPVGGFVRPQDIRKPAVNRSPTTTPVQPPTEYHALSKMLDTVPGVPRQANQINVVLFYLTGSNLSALFSGMRQEFMRVNEDRLAQLQPRPHVQFYDVEISDPTEMPPAIRVLDADYVLCNNVAYNLYLVAASCRPDLESDLVSAIVFGRLLFGRSIPTGFLSELPTYDRNASQPRRMFLLNGDGTTENTLADLHAFLSAMLTHM